ncbi:MAG TPA: alpha-hydroxy acid oxidase [Microbacteriaceae bacterium]|nr:alpha-hydroxy acid oxidase [Microbacteriaceae bacterium]
MDPENRRDATRADVEAYYETGSGAEVTLRENEAAWSALRFRPHVLRDVGTVTTRTTLFGATLDVPIGIAPSALHGLAHPEGECATARAANASGTLFVLSMRSSRSVEEVAAAAGGAPWWYQVYATVDRSVALRLAANASAAGAQALVLTGDTPLVARKRRAFPGVVPIRAHVANLRHRLTPPPTASDIRQDPTVTPSFIAELAKATGLPVLVKGVVRGDDADRLIAAGAAGIVVSNHGGRQLDRTVATADALPEVVVAVAGRVPVLVDGGIRTGGDVLAALCLGADAVLVGRPVLRALGRGGEAEVTRLLHGLQQELAEALALAGVRSPAETSPDMVRVSPRPLGRAALPQRLS